MIKQLNIFFRTKFQTKIFVIGFVGYSILFWGLYQGLFVSPPDYQQEEYVRIMYVHVPSAWLALGIYTSMGLFSFIYLIWRNPLMNLIANKSGLVGALFALITLVTGSIWGKPIWGTWWVWDARLTSMLILFLFYLGYIMLVSESNEYSDNKNGAAVLCCIGVINVPIVKFSVEYWASLHQKASVLKLSSPTIHHEMLKPLILVFVGASIVSFCIIAIRVKTQIIHKKNLRSKIVLDRN